MSVECAVVVSQC